jgi:hypothetical protein
MQLCMALTPTSLARRKPGVQIPSPPPQNQQVRASSASSGRRSLHVAAALRPREQVAVQLGRLSATRRLGPGPHTVTTERSRRLQPELPIRCDARQSRTRSHAGSGRWSSCSRIRQDGQIQTPLLTMCLPAAPTSSTSSPVRTQRDADAERADTDAGHRTSTPGHWTVNAWTSHARTLEGHTRHRTLDTGRVERPSTRTG